jgi:hypothetical protein
MMPPEYCHSCNGDGVCADANGDKQPHPDSTRKYSARKQTLLGIPGTRFSTARPLALTIRADGSAGDAPVADICCRRTLRRTGPDPVHGARRAAVKAIVIVQLAR